MMKVPVAQRLDQHQVRMAGWVRTKLNFLKRKDHTLLSHSSFPFAPLQCKNTNKNLQHHELWRCFPHLEIRFEN